MPVWVQKAAEEFTEAIRNKDLDEAEKAFNKIITWYPKERKNLKIDVEKWRR